MIRFISLFIFLCCDLLVFGQDIPVPEGYDTVSCIKGDLDKDGIDELVVAYNTKKEEKDFEGIPRELIIYKFLDTKWMLWKRSMQALMGSRDGGMMGDPFGDIEIKNGLLIISHYGGSSWKWGQTDKYRYQNGEFYLIGFTNTFGKPCEYWEEADFNLSTGTMDVKKEYEDCEGSEQKNYKSENESVVRKGIKITLQGRKEREVKIVTPKYKHEIYISSKD